METNKSVQVCLEKVIITTLLIVPIKEEINLWSSILHVYVFVGYVLIYFLDCTKIITRIILVWKLFKNYSSKITYAAFLVSLFQEYSYTSFLDPVSFYTWFWVQSHGQYVSLSLHNIPFVFVKVNSLRDFYIHILCIDSRWSDYQYVGQEIYANIPIKLFYHWFLCCILCQYFAFQVLTSLGQFCLHF